MARRRKYSEEPYEANQIAEQSPAEVETTGPETINGIIINAKLVNVRKKPSFHSEVLEVLREGDMVTILDSEGEYYKVSTSVNKEAYIYGSYVKIKEE